MYTTRDHRPRGTGSVLRTTHRFSEASQLLATEDNVPSYNGDNGDNGYHGYNGYNGGAVEVAPVAAPSAVHRVCSWLLARLRAAFSAVGRVARKWQLLLACAGLLLMTSVERVTFKLSVDRLAEFRCLAAQMLVLMYLLICGVIVAFKICFTNDISRGMYHFPQWKLASIAVLDTIQLLLYFGAGAAVTPAQTVLLLQLQVPLVALFAGTKDWCSNISRNQILGSIGILASVFLAALGSLGSVASDEDDEAGVVYLYCVVLYVLAALPAAGSTVLKERAMVSFGKPMEPALMNSMLAAYQLLFALLFSPLALQLQSFLTPDESLDWSLLQETADNGVLCVLIGQNPISIDDDDENFRTACPGGVFILFAHAVAVLSLPLIATTVLSTGKIRHIYGMVVAATGLSVVILGLTLGEDSGILGSSLRPLELLALGMLLPSLLLYHSEPEHGIEIITQHERVLLDK
mmetsp:Transcript_7936/g.29692  ORF Transcript_7936/g.29692 Transcript_7936/m.29692 type:complete len:462 (-) Transcript_7936:189-1574(-)